MVIISSLRCPAVDTQLMQSSYIYLYISITTHISSFFSLKYEAYVFYLIDLYCKVFQFYVLILELQLTILAYFFLFIYDVLICNLYLKSNYTASEHFNSTKDRRSHNPSRYHRQKPFQSLLFYADTVK